MTNENADFTQGSILKKLVAFMIPILGALILQAAYGAVDLIVVGRYGSTSGLSGGFDRQSGAESGDICCHTACNGYYGADRQVSG